MFSGYLCKIQQTVMDTGTQGQGTWNIVSAEAGFSSLSIATSMLVFISLAFSLCMFLWVFASSYKPPVLLVAIAQRPHLALIFSLVAPSLVKLWDITSLYHLYMGQKRVNDRYILFEKVFFFLLSISTCNFLYVFTYLFSC